MSANISDARVSEIANEAADTEMRRLAQDLRDAREVIKAQRETIDAQRDELQWVLRLLEHELDAVNAARECPRSEADQIFDLLYELPVETRRALFIKLSEFPDGFCNSPARRTKNWAKHEGRSR